MLPSTFCSAKLTSVFWKTLLTAFGSVALAASQPWSPGSRLPASRPDSSARPEGPVDRYTAQELHALRTVDRAIREGGAGNGARALRKRDLTASGLRVGMRWVVGIERVRPQGMKPPGEQKVAATYAQSLRDLAVFRYEVVARNPDGGFEIRILPISDSGAQVNTPMIDPNVEEVRLTLDTRGRQVAKSYIYRKGTDDRAVPVEVSPDGIRSKLTALEVFPLDWPSDLASVLNSESRDSRRVGAASAALGLQVPPGLSELIIRSEHVMNAPGGGGSPIRAMFRGEEDLASSEGSDFFGRPVVARLSRGFPWPVAMETAQGVAVLLKIESRGEG